MPCHRMFGKPMPHQRFLLPMAGIRPRRLMMQVWHGSNRPLLIRQNALSGLALMRSSCMPPMVIFFINSCHRSAINAMMPMAVHWKTDCVIRWKYLMLSKLLFLPICRFWFVFRPRIGLMAAGMLSRPSNLPRHLMRLAVLRFMCRVVAIHWRRKSTLAMVIRPILPNRSVMRWQCRSSLLG